MLPHFQFPKILPALGKISENRLGKSGCNNATYGCSHLMGWRGALTDRYRARMRAARHRIEDTKGSDCSMKIPGPNAWALIIDRTSTA